MNDDIAPSDGNPYVDLRSAVAYRLMRELKRRLGSSKAISDALSRGDARVYGVWNAIDREALRQRVAALPAERANPGNIGLIAFDGVVDAFRQVGWTDA